MTTTETSPGIGRVSRIGPTHARGLDRLVGMNVSVRQGDPFKNIRLDFELSCGIAPIRIADGNFEIGLRTCFVSLFRENCTVKADTTYEHWINVGELKLTETVKQSTESGYELEGGLNAQAQSSGLLAGISAKFGLGGSRKRKALSEATSEQHIRTELIATSGQDRWRVGHVRRGDARRQDGLLSGMYFREAHGGDGDPKPICHLAQTDQFVPVLVTLAVTASFGSTVVFREDMAVPEADHVVSGAHTLLRRRSSSATTQHEKLLRAHVAGLAVAKAIRTAQIASGAIVPENEYLVAKQTLVILDEEVLA